MRILILGGTVFLGRHLVTAAQARGHTVTLFNRGQHNPDLFPDVEKLRGDRGGNLDALRGRQWDAAIDTSGYLPRVVRQSADLLKDAVGHYTFISTLNVYPNDVMNTPDLPEDSSLATLPEAWSEDQAEALYGPLKAACEATVTEAMPERALLVRLGLLIGPHDPTNRFTYWPIRIARGGDVLIPDARNRSLRLVVDARDVAAWNIHAVERGLTGPYNVFGPDYALTLGNVLDTCKDVSGSDAQFVPVAEQFLLDHEVRPWMEIPLWVPTRPGAPSFTARATKAIDAGLTFRPLADTVRDTLAWDRTQPADTPRPAGLAPEREQELLAAWRAKQGG